MLARQVFAVVIAIAFAAPAAAQNQTIQLPTFAYTTVATTVSVPDQGQAYLGGINRLRSGRNQTGTPLVGKLPFIGRPFNNVGIGRELSGQHISVTAYIHDFEAMDQALLSQAAARRNGGLFAGRGAATNHRIGLNPAANSVAAIRQQQRTVDNTVTDEMQDLLQRARDAEANGKPHVAKIFYRMLSREATGEMQKLAIAKLNMLSGASEKIVSTSAR